MTSEQLVIQFLDRVSRGLVRLSSDQAKRLVKIIVNNPEETVSVTRYTFNGGNQNYAPSYTSKVDRTKAIEIIHSLSNVKQTEGFYLYRIAELDFEFYSARINLFP